MLSLGNPFCCSPCLPLLLIDLHTPHLPQVRRQLSSVSMKLIEGFQGRGAGRHLPDGKHDAFLGRMKQARETFPPARIFWCSPGSEIKHRRRGMWLAFGTPQL